MQNREETNSSAIACPDAKILKHLRTWICTASLAALLMGCNGGTFETDGRKGIQCGAWYSDGTLHESTLAQWRRATYANRLATSADFSAKVLQMKGIKLDSMGELRPYAEKLETCISEASEARGVDQTVVREIAAACFVLFDAGI